MLILASTSPFRASLLRSAGIGFEAVSPGVDEIAREGLCPRELAMDFARQKAFAVSARFPDRLVLGCDQTLEIGGRLIRKPASRDEARSELSALSGRTHELHSALCLVRKNGGLLRETVETVRLTMHPLADSDIEAYLDTGEWQGCAGAFRIEGMGLRLFDAIEGSYHAIIGLPMLPLIRMLRELGELPAF